MIRMVFYPVLEMDEPKLQRLITKLAPLSCRTLIEPRGRSFIFIETDQLADSLAYSLRAKNYTHCKGCNTLHFKDEFTRKDPFICLCGTHLNKIK